MLAELTCQRAELQDGQSVLELGCGWGSVCLYIANCYPNSQVTAVSNSRTQKEFIEQQSKLRGLANLTILTADVAHFQAPSTYDRIVSVEMFEHMKNYGVSKHSAGQSTSLESIPHSEGNALCLAY